MINFKSLITKLLGTTCYVSTLDRFLNTYRKTQEYSASQHQEMTKSTQISALRDQPSSTKHPHADKITFLLS